MSTGTDGPTEPSHSSALKSAVKAFSLTSRPGTKEVSSTTKVTNRPSPSSTLGKRPRAALQDSLDDEEETPGRHEAVTGFDIREGGALKKDEVATSGPLVIPMINSGSGRAQMRQAMQRRTNGLRSVLQVGRTGDRGASEANGEDVVNGVIELEWGLAITKKSITGEKNSDARSHHTQGDIRAEREDTPEIPVEKTREKTIEEQAMEAIIGLQSQPKGPDLIISAPENEYSNHIRHDREEEAFRHSVRLAADVSSQEDYNRVPEGEFGYAMLRGMGWKKDDDERRRTVEQRKDRKRRQNLLGLGATKLKEAEELGAWVQKIDPKQLGKGSSRDGERRPRANEYREREEKRRDNRDERYGGSHRRDRDNYGDGIGDRNRDRRR